MNRNLLTVKVVSKHSRKRQRGLMGPCACLYRGTIKLRHSLTCLHQGFAFLSVKKWSQAGKQAEFYLMFLIHSEGSLCNIDTTITSKTYLSVLNSIQLIIKMHLKFKFTLICFQTKLNRNLAYSMATCLNVNLDNIQKCVLLENTPLVHFIRNYIRGPSGVFPDPHK